MKRGFIFVFFVVFSSFTFAQDEIERRIEKLGEIPKIASDFEGKKIRLPDLEKVGVEVSKQKPLSLQDVITLALENNKDIEIFRQNVKSAEFDLKATRGSFEPRFIGQSYFERSKTPNVTIFSSNQTITNESLVNSLSFQSFIPRFGSTLALSLNNQRTKTDNTFSILSPQENTNLNLSLTQPLIRGRKIDQKRRSIEIAKKNLSLTDAQFRQKVIDVITSAQKAYWDLTFALRNFQVQVDAVKDAKKQLEHNRRLVEEGQLAPIDIVAMETQVANFEQNVYDALNLVQVTENALKMMIAKGKDDPIWSESIIPIDPVELDVPRFSLNEALEIALTNRPEVELNEIQKDINQIEQDFYKDQIKPQIDLTASYISAGIGGSQNPSFRPPFPLPCQIDPNSPACRQQLALLNSITGSSINDIFINRYPTFRVGITVSLPFFGNQTQRALLGKTLVEAEKIKLQRQQIEQAIQMDVRNALQMLRTAEARLRTATIARENLEKQYESEQRKLEAGQSDVYKLLERQTALAMARSNELRAQIELNKAIADLQRVTGNSLKANNINIETRLRNEYK